MPPRAPHPRKKATAVEVVGDRDLSGKVALITGANSGIGFETARALASRNCHVFMACRNQKTAAEAKMAILKEYDSANISLLQLDLCELESVKKCATAFLSFEKRLDVLILNAGVYNPQHRVTDDGFEATFHINHLSQFLLTQLLIDKLVSSAPSRIVVVSSDAHKLVLSMSPTELTWQKLSPTHLHGLNSAMTAYGLSKFCNVLFARELNRQLKTKGVTVYSVHPGVVKTNISRNPGSWSFMVKMMGPFMKTGEQGAATTVYVAVWEGIEDQSGEYFVNCRRKQTTGPSRNLDNADKLWQISQQMIHDYEQQHITDSDKK